MSCLSKAARSLRQLERTGHTSDLLRGLQGRHSCTATAGSDRVWGKPIPNAGAVMDESIFEEDVFVKRSLDLKLDL
jgi:hypothetical protein